MFRETTVTPCVTCGVPWEGRSSPGHCKNPDCPAEPLRTVVRPNVTPVVQSALRPLPLLLATAMSIPWWVGAWTIWRWVS